MSETIATGPGKQICQRCKRTTVIVLVDGERVSLDPEITTVVVYPCPMVKGKAQGVRVTARRVHADLCMRYQAENERKAMLLAQRKARRT